MALSTSARCIWLYMTQFQGACRRFPGIRCRSIHLRYQKKGTLGIPVGSRSKTDHNQKDQVQWRRHHGVESNHRAYRERQLILVGSHRAAFSLAHAHAHRLVLRVKLCLDCRKKQTEDERNPERKRGALSPYYNILFILSATLGRGSMMKMRLGREHNERLNVDVTRSRRRTRPSSSPRSSRDTTWMRAMRTRMHSKRRRRLCDGR